MNLPHDLQKRLIERFGRIVDLKENPAVLAAIAEEVRQSPDLSGSSPAAPFGVSWMDSWVAHWIYDEKQKSAISKDRELGTALRALVDIRFSERLAELQLFVRDHPGRLAEPPDAGPPEPGPKPPAGPSAFEPPDGGPPEPGTPEPPEPGTPEPPDGGPPEPGTPNPPGPDQGFLGENPWILYWFVSLKAPALLSVIDAHFNRRLDELAIRVQGRSGS